VFSNNFSESGFFPFPFGNNSLFHLSPFVEVAVVFQTLLALVFPVLLCPSKAKLLERRFLLKF
jgi:hypothetical protein